MCKLACCNYGIIKDYSIRATGNILVFWICILNIIKVNCICPLRDIYGVSEDEMASSTLSPSVVEAFYEHRTIPRGTRKTPADVLVSHVCFAWELVYPESRAVMHEQGHLEQMLGRRFRDPHTQETFEAMGAHMRSLLFRA